MKRTLLFLPLFAGLYSPATRAESTSGWDFMPVENARPALWADGREPMSRVIGRSGDTRIEATLADGVVFTEYTTDAFSLQVGLAAGGFLSFDPSGALTFALMTFDGLVAIPFTLTHGRFAHTLEWAHVSAHYADGIRGVLGYGEIDTGTYSREYARWITAWESGAWMPYVGGQWLLHRIPEAARPGAQAGLQWVAQDGLPLFLAVDGKLAAEHDWRVRTRGQLGVHFMSRGDRDMQLGLECARGPDEKGKWQGREDVYCGGFLALDRRSGH